MKSSVKAGAAQVQCEIDPMIYGHFIENMGRCIYGGILQNERPGRITGPWGRNGPSAEAMNWYGRDEVVCIEKPVRDAGDVLPLCRFPAHSATALVMKR